MQVIRQALSNRPKTVTELLRETNLPERTLRYNIAILKKIGEIKEIPLFSDLRKKVFVLSKVDKRC